MTKIKGDISNNFCPQSLYLYGNYEEDGVTPHFGLFCWYGWCWLGEGAPPWAGASSCPGCPGRSHSRSSRPGAAVAR